MRTCIDGFNYLSYVQIWIILSNGKRHGKRRRRCCIELFHYFICRSSYRGIKQTTLEDKQTSGLRKLSVPTFNIKPLSDCTLYTVNCAYLWVDPVCIAPGDVSGLMQILFVLTPLRLCYLYMENVCTYLTSRWISAGTCSILLSERSSEVRPSSWSNSLGILFSWLHSSCTTRRLGNLFYKFFILVILFFWAKGQYLILLYFYTWIIYIGSIFYQIFPRFEI